MRIVCCFMFLITCSSVPFVQAQTVIPANKVVIPAKIEEPLDFIPKKYYNDVVASAQKYKIPVIYLGRLLYEESGFNPKAVYKNKNGTVDKGIAQLNSAYIDEFGWRYGFGKIDPFNAKQSIEVAAKHLSILYKHISREVDGEKLCWYLTMAAYNCGLERTKRFDIPPKTREYALRIVYGNV